MGYFVIWEETKEGAVAEKGRHPEKHRLTGSERTIEISSRVKSGIVVFPENGIGCGFTECTGSGEGK